MEMVAVMVRGVLRVMMMEMMILTFSSDSYR